MVRRVAVMMYATVQLVLAHEGRRRRWCVAVIVIPSSRRSRSISGSAERQRPETDLEREVIVPVRYALKTTSANVREGDRERDRHCWR